MQVASLTGLHGWLQDRCHRLGQTKAVTVYRLVNHCWLRAAVYQGAWLLAWHGALPAACRQAPVHVCGKFSRLGCTAMGPYELVFK